MSTKKEIITVAEIERALGLHASVSKAPLNLRDAIEKYLATFREARVGEASALVSNDEEVPSSVFMSIVNPGDQLLASLRRTKEDRAYWSRRKQRTATKASVRKRRNADDDEESEPEEESVLTALDRWSTAPGVKAVTRRRKPTEVLFGFRCSFTPEPGETWTTDIRFITFNEDWVCAIGWHGAWNDPSENTTLPIILGFANRRDLWRSIMLLLSQPHDWWWLPSGLAEIYPVGRKRPPAHYLKAIEICCRRDGSFSRMGDDDGESSYWADVLPLLTEDELMEVVARIDNSDLHGSQIEWMREHGVDEENVNYDADALLGTFTKKRKQLSLPFRLSSKKARTYR